MGIFDLLTSTKRPPAGAKQLPQQEVLQALINLNRPTAPYHLVDGQAEGVDLIAEWRIVDAQWYEIFAKAGVSNVFRIYLKFKPRKYEVRALDKEYTVTWTAGVPKLSASGEYFRGQKCSLSSAWGFGFKETLEPGVVYSYQFNTKEIKKPIQDAVTGCGWTYKGVTFGKL